MPTIPGQTQPTVRADPASPVYQRVQVDPNAFGANVAAAGQRVAGALDQAAEMVARNAERMAAEDNAARAKEADAEVMRKLRDLEVNPETGFFGRKGKAAVDGFDGAFVAATEIGNEVMGALPAPARKLVGDTIGRRVLDTQTRMSQHTMGERRTWLVSASQARVEAAQTAAAGDYTNEGLFNETLKIARGEAFEQGKLQGWDEGTVAVAAQKYTDRAWKDRLEAQRLHDPVGALATYQRNAQQLDPALRLTMGQQLYTAAAPVLAAQLNAMGGPPIPAPNVPIIRNADGSVSTERSITIEAKDLNGGKPTNIPTIWDGKQLSDDEAIARAVKSGRTFQSFDSTEAAVEAAKARSAAGGALSLPRGVRNNNPGNIVKSAVRWEGELEGTDPRYTSFETPEAGIRALAVNLRTYQDKYGLNTVEGIVGRWAPATENDTAGYVKTVAKDLGVKPDQPLNLADAKLLTGLTRAIIKHENGKVPYTDAQITAGVEGKVPKASAGYSETTPAQAATMVTGNPVVDQLPPDWKMHVIALAKTQASQDRTQMREALKYRVADDVAAYAQGKTPPNPVSGVEVMAAYGQEEGARKLQEIEAAREYGADVRTVATLSTSQQAELLARRAPQPGEGFEISQRRHEALGRAIDQVRRDREQDPAAYALKNTPAVMEAYRAMANAPGDQRAAASQAYAAAAIAEQQRLEVPDPKILPKNYVDEITRRFYQPASTKDGEQPAAMANIVRGVSEQWGRFAPQVWAQLSKTGGIPPDAVVLALGVKPEAEQLLSEAFRLKPEQLRQGMPEADVKDLRERVASAFEPLRDTLPPYLGGSTSTYDAYVDSAEKMATMLVRGGMKPKEAAAKAFDSMIGFKYDFEGTWRVPKNVIGGSVTVSAIRDGAHMARFDIAEKAELSVPAVSAAVRPEDALKQWRQTVQDSGFWITSPARDSATEPGLTLYVRSGLSAQPVLDATGRPIRRTWNELSHEASSTRAAFAGDVPGLADRMRGGRR